jgi:DUF1680 family protein
VRIPAWAGAKTIVSVNGKRVDGEIAPGKFLAVQRTWKHGDRVEIEMETPLRLEGIEPESPNIVALMRGPLAMFAIGENPAHPTRDQLMTATASAQSSDDWVVSTGSGPVTLRSFAAIKDEPYRLYHTVGG